MSESRVAGLVCEGHTDVPILRAVVQAIWPDLEEVRCLQPELDEIERAKGPAGWSQVRAWCLAHASDLHDVLDPDIGAPIDLLVIAIDLDIAIEAKIANPPKKGPGLYEAKRLRDVMLSWLGCDEDRRLPSSVLLGTPVMAIEAWIIAALFPKQKLPEGIRDPAAMLVEKKKLRRSPTNGKPWKELHRYRDEFAPLVGARFGRVRKMCEEADRFGREVERRRGQCG